METGRTLTNAQVRARRSILSTDLRTVCARVKPRRGFTLVVTVRTHTNAQVRAKYTSPSMYLRTVTR